MVKNKRSEDIHLVVYDQVPISTTDDIKVSDIKTSGAVHNETTGQLKHILDIPAKQKIEKVLAYSVTSPIYMHLYVD